jgi:hypothetical protein
MDDARSRRAFTGPRAADLPSTTSFSLGDGTRGNMENQMITAVVSDERVVRGPVFL